MMRSPARSTALPAALLGLLLLAASPAAAQQPTAQPLSVDVQRRVLDNGLTVLVWERPSAGRIGTRVFYRVDIAAERPGTAGLTHMLEHHLFKGSDVSGTVDWEAERAIAERVERLEREITDDENRNRGCFLQRDVFAEVEVACRTPRLDSLRAELEAATAAQNRLANTTWYDWAVQGAGGTNSTASTGRDWMKFDIDLPANKLELFMWTERNRLEHPVFRHFEPEKEVVVDQIRRSDNRPDGPFSRVLRSMTYDAHPYGWAHWFSDLTRATREDHWEIFHKYFIPQNTILVVVGEVKADDVFRMAEAYWGSWREGRPSPRLRTVEPAPVGQKRLLVEAAAGPTVAIHVPMPAIGHPDAHVFEVLSELLGGPRGLLTRELVGVRGVATQAGTAGSTSKYPSHFELRVDARTNEELDAVEAGISDVLRRITDGNVPPLEVQAAASRLVLGLARSFDEIGSSAVTIGSMEAIHRWEHLNDLPTLWAAVTPADLARIVSRYFSPQMQTVGVLRRVPAAPATQASESGDVGVRNPAGIDTASPAAGISAMSQQAAAPPRSSTQPPLAQPQAAAAAAPPSATQVPPATHPSTAQAPLAVAELPWYAPPWLAARRPSAFAAPPPVRDYRALRFEPTTFTPPVPADFQVAVPGGPAAFVVTDSLLPMVQLTVLIDAPRIAEPAGREGIALLTAELVQRSGTTARAADEVEAALNRLGATMRMTSDANRTRLHAVAPAAAADSLLVLVAELVARPRLDAVFATERDRLAVRAGRAADDAATQVRSLFERTLYGDAHPLGRRATTQSVGAITLDDVRAFHARHYAADRIVFAVSGAVAARQVERALAGVFAAAPGAAPPLMAGTALPGVREPRGIHIVTHDLDTRQGHVMIGHLGIEGQPDDHAALEVMHHILAGGGFISRMMELLRTQTGITSALYGEVEPGRGVPNPYLWRFSGNPETLARGVRLALEEIRRLRDDGVTAEEFEAARTAYIDGLIPASYDTPHKTAERLAHRHLFGRYAYQSPQYLNYYAGDGTDLHALRRLTLEDVNRAARRYLQPDDVVITIVGPLATIRAAASAEERALLQW
jgi:predicted Zn-dependent peptidase